MSERPTPETDAAEYLNSIGRKNDQWVVRSDVSRKLERERDEAREKLENEMKWHHRTHRELIEAQCKLLDIEYDKLKS
jgi:hypothetical protein